MLPLRVKVRGWELLEAMEASHSDTLASNDNLFVTYTLGASQVIRWDVCELDVPVTCRRCSAAYCQRHTMSDATAAAAV